LILNDFHKPRNHPNRQFMIARLSKPFQNLKKAKELHAPQFDHQNSLHRFASRLGAVR
jgi:hypothetical protein